MQIFIDLTFCLKNIHTCKQKNPKIMTRNKKIVPENIKSGKCDIIYGIIVGNQQTNALCKREREERTPAGMIKKLSSILKNSSDEELKAKSQAAIEKLSTINNQEHQLIDTVANKIYKEVCGE